MGGKGGDSGGGSFTGNMADQASTNPAMRARMGLPPLDATPSSTVPTLDELVPPTTTMPTQGDDAKTPGPPTDTGSGAVTDDTGGGATTGDTAVLTLAAPQYWFNQPVSTLSPKAIKSKLKTTGSV